MELRWWWVVFLGLALLLAVIAAAYLWPMRQRPRQLRPMAWVQRLTQLPEYVRAYRRYRMMMVCFVAVTLVLLAGVIVATARPVSTRAAAAEINREYPEDITLCVADDPAAWESSVLLGYFRDAAKTLSTQRLGLTSSSLRVIPLTRDYPYLQQRLGFFAGLAELKAKDQRTPDQENVLLRGKREFASDVSYSDYTPTVNDVLALCMTGFPHFDKPSERRRSLIYLGPTRSNGNSARGIYSDAQLAQLARGTHVQLNVLTPASAEEGEAVKRLAEASGGRFISYITDDTQHSEVDRQKLAKVFYKNIDEIVNNPPAITQSDGTILVQRPQDQPNVILMLILVTTVIFAAALVGVRR